MFYENNTHEAWCDAKALGCLDELMAGEPNPPARIYAMYNTLMRLRRDVSAEHRVPQKELYEAARLIDYEPDKAVQVMQAADDNFLHLCAEKIKRLNKK